MKRRSLFAWLAGAMGLGAQDRETYPLPQRGTDALAQTGPLLDDRARPYYRNGYCPQCSTKAPQLHKPMELDYYPSGYVRYDEKGRTYPINLTRCATCSNAFFQDAEETK